MALAKLKMQNISSQLFTSSNRPNAGSVASFSVLAISVILVGVMLWDVMRQNHWISLQLVWRWLDAIAFFPNRLRKVLRSGTVSAIGHSQVSLSWQSRASWPLTSPSRTLSRGKGLHPRFAKVLLGKSWHSLLIFGKFGRMTCWHKGMTFGVSKYSLYLWPTSRGRGLLHQHYFFFSSHVKSRF